MHEVILRLIKGKVHVSCICRTKPPTTENGSDGSRSNVPIGPTRDLDESRTLYNDPDNHWAPFTEEDKAKW